MLLRLDQRKSAMRLLIDALPSDAASISLPAVKLLLQVLLSSTHTKDVSPSLTPFVFLCLWFSFLGEVKICPVNLIGNKRIV